MTVRQNVGKAKCLTAKWFWIQRRGAICRATKNQFFSCPKSGFNKIEFKKMKNKNVVEKECTNIQRVNKTF